MESTSSSKSPSPSWFSWFSWFSRWSFKQYVFTSLLGALAAIVVVAGFSISLSPAHIFFTITNATTSLVPVEGNPHLSNGFYNLTLVAHNPSRRTSAQYCSLSAQIWYSATGYIIADDIDSLPGWQPPRNAAAVAVSAEYGQYDVDEPRGPEAAGNATTTTNTTDQKQLVDRKASGDCRVVVQAKVRFRFGRMHTMPYTVRVTCLHVNFTAGGTNDGPVGCS